VDEVRMLDRSDCSCKGAIGLDTTVTKITGGDILDNTLYLAANSDGREKVTYAVDLTTGQTKEAFVRDTGDGTAEAEGLAISQTDDGAAYFHYVDVAFASKTILRRYHLADSR
jgi:hypothetical protein